MIFVAVGSQFPFDRLVRAVDESLGRNGFPYEVFGQIGHTSFKPRHFQSVPLMPHARFMEAIEKSEGVVSHAGVGIILTCLELGVPILVMPRRAVHGEVVNDHQVGTATRLAQAGRILMARDENELIELLPELPGFAGSRRPRRAEGVPQRIRDFLTEVDP